MATTMNRSESPVLYVIHPLDEEPEEKRTGDGLDQIEMSAAVKGSLIALRGYLILMLLLVIYRVLDLAGLFGHHLKGT